jgi:hypothetical protein
MTPLAAAEGLTSWNVDWAWSLALIVVTVMIHVIGLGLLQLRVVRTAARLFEHRRFILLFAPAMAVTVFSVTILHVVEGLIWAGAYRYLGALPDIRSAVLFSFGAMTAYGGSDLDLPAHWRLLGALEALNGIILIGLSTAFLFTTMQDVRAEAGRHRH